MKKYEKNDFNSLTESELILLEIFQYTFDLNVNNKLSIFEMGQLVRLEKYFNSKQKQINYEKTIFNFKK
jgi:hypothetical protein